jgi:hypothetical protein
MIRASGGFAFLFGLVLVAVACQSGEDVGSSTANVEVGPCGSLIEDLSGEGRTPASIAAHNDVVAKKLLHPQGACATTFKAVVTELRAGGCGKDGMMADVVSERSALLREPEGGRVVLFPRCHPEAAGFVTGSKADFDLLLAPLKPVSPTSTIGEKVELIARDETSGVFNFYAVEDGKWRFFGDSRTMLKGPGNGEERRCANCHASGGLVMKELETPWQNWDHSNTDNQPGIDDVRANLAKQLGVDEIGFASNPGSRFFGMELTVKKGNAAWNEARIAHVVKTGTLAQLVEPLLCTKELNLENGFSNDLFVHEAGPRQFADGIVEKAQASLQQVMMDREKRPLTRFKRNDRGDVTSEREPATDTVSGFFRAVPGQIDTTYAELLVEKKIISQKLVDAIRRVDVTRPIFSDDRCSLVRSLPSVDIAKRGAASRIDAAVIKALEEKQGRSAAETELLRNLREPDTAAGARLDAFFQKCADRAKTEPDALALDLGKVISSHRNAIRARRIAEAAELLPFDVHDAPPGKRLRLEDCKLE